MFWQTLYALENITIKIMETLNVVTVDPNCDRCYDVECSSNLRSSMLCCRLGIKEITQKMVSSVIRQGIKWQQKCSLPKEKARLRENTRKMEE